MSVRPDRAEMAQLLALPAFRRFLWRVVTASGLLQASHDGDAHDLAFREGRRSLALELLQLAEAGQAVRHPFAITTWLGVLSEEHQSHLETQSHDRDSDRPRNRYERDRAGGRSTDE